MVTGSTSMIRKFPLDSIFLEGMVAAYSSRVGSKQLNEDGQPQVVIPVGGG